MNQKQAVSDAIYTAALAVANAWAVLSDFIEAGQAIGQLPSDYYDRDSEEARESDTDETKALMESETILIDAEEWLSDIALRLTVGSPIVTGKD